MGRFAENTSVSVAKSRGEIEDMVMRYGGSEFASLLRDGEAWVGFKIGGRAIRFILPLPNKADFKTRPYRDSHRDCGPEEQHARWEQACRTAWRALLLTIKAKLESAHSKIETFDEAFLAQIVLANGKTIGEVTAPQLAHVTVDAKAPLMLGMG